MEYERHLAERHMIHRRYDDSLRFRKPLSPPSLVIKEEKPILYRPSPVSPASSLSPTYRQLSPKSPGVNYRLMSPPSEPTTSRKDFKPPQRVRQKRRFQCMYCEKSFGKSSHLRDHHRTHSGERPFGCRFCGKAFSQFSNLRTHLRIHTGEKPFKCGVCDKSFTQRVTLRSHMRTHSNSKKFFEK